MWSENPLGRAGNQGLTCTVAQTSDHPERVCGSPTVTQLPTGQAEVIGRSVTLSSPGCSGPQDVWLSAPLRNGAAVKVYNPKTSTKNFILLLTHTRILMCNRSTLSQGILDLSPHPQLGIQRWQGSEWASRRENWALRPVPQRSKARGFCLLSTLSFSCLRAMPVPGKAWARPQFHCLTSCATSSVRILSEPWFAEM